MRLGFWRTTRRVRAHRFNGRCLTSTQPFVTELDLRLAQVSMHSIDYLKEAIPSQSNEVGEPEYDYETWLDQVFA